MCICPFNLSRCILVVVFWSRHCKSQMISGRNKIAIESAHFLSNNFQSFYLQIQKLLVRTCCMYMYIREYYTEKKKLLLPNWIKLKSVRIERKKPTFFITCLSLYTLSKKKSITSFRRIIENVSSYLENIWTVKSTNLILKEKTWTFC